MIATSLERDERATTFGERRSNGEPAQSPLTFLIGYGRGTPALASGLDRSGLAVRAFDRFSAARAEIERARPDLILVGDEQIEGSSLDFIRQLRQDRTDALVFFLAPNTNPGLVGAALEAGADDVCGPPHSVGAVVVRRLVNLRRRDVPDTRPRPRKKRPITLAGLTVDPFTREVSDGRVPFTLSGRELELLVHLMEAAGDVVTREKLLQEIWGDEQQDDAVLDATVHRLRKRLEERLSRPGFVATVRGVGYRLKKE